MRLAKNQIHKRFKLFTIGYEINNEIQYSNFHPIT